MQMLLPFLWPKSTQSTLFGRIRLLNGTVEVSSYHRSSPYRVQSGSINIESRRIAISARNGRILPRRLNTSGFSTSARSNQEAVVDHYKTLGLTKGATKGQIKRRFYELSKLHHPDVRMKRQAAADTPGQTQNDEDASEAKFLAISEAYGVLGNDSARRDYDRRTAAGSHSTSGSTHTHYGRSTVHTHGPHSSWHHRRNQAHSHASNAHPRTSRHDEADAAHARSAAWERMRQDKEQSGQPGSRAYSAPFTRVEPKGPVEKPHFEPYKLNPYKYRSDREYQVGKEGRFWNLVLLGGGIGGLLYFFK